MKTFSIKTLEMLPNANSEEQFQVNLMDITRIYKTQEGQFEKDSSRIVFGCLLKINNYLVVESVIFETKFLTEKFFFQWELDSV